jgi:hypothetical protein
MDSIRFPYEFHTQRFTVNRWNREFMSKRIRQPNFLSFLPARVAGSALKTSLQSPPPSGKDRAGEAQ